MGDAPEGFVSTFITMMALLVLLSLTVLIAFGLFSPVWFLLDAGIVYSNQERVEKKKLGDPIIGRSVGGWYMYLLKGYAGISVIFTYINLMTAFFTGFTTVEGDRSLMTIMGIINALVMIPLVFFIALASIPALIILDITKEKRVKYIRNWANKFGITESVKIRFEKSNS